MLFINSIERLKNHWISHGLRFNAGVSIATLVAFERKFGVSLPPKLRDYFLSMNGMPEDVSDDEMIRFWTLDEVKPLPIGAPSFARSEYIENPESLFLFADHSLWAHAYAIRLFPDALTRNDVFIIGGTNPILIFKSFGEFIESYLTDKDRLFSANSLE